MTNDSDSFPLRLVGYYSSFDRGFAIPIYGSSFNANILYAAECYPPGDHRGFISSFNEVDRDGVVPLLYDDLPSVRINSSWINVFIWDGDAFVGNPNQIWSQISGKIVHFRKEAPLIVFDLASISLSLAVHSELRNAIRHLKKDFGHNAAMHWVSTILRREIILGISRSLARGNQSEFIDLLEEGIEVNHSSKDGFDIFVSSSIANLSEIGYLYEISPLVEEIYAMFALKVNVKDGSKASKQVYQLKFTDIDSSDYFNNTIKKDKYLHQLYAWIFDNIHGKYKDAMPGLDIERVLRNSISQAIFENSRHKRRSSLRDNYAILLMRHAQHIFLDNIPQNKND